MKTNYFLATGLLIASMNLNAQQELIENGSFELGEQGWDFSLSSDAIADFGSCDADEGDNYLWFGDLDELTGYDNIDDEIGQMVTLPANLDYAEFICSWSGVSAEGDDINEFDFLDVTIVDENGNEIYTEYISNADMDITLTTEDCDVWVDDIVFTIPSEYAGQDIEIFFTVTTDDAYPTIFRIDNVSLVAYTTSGLNETIESQISISPNPANENLTITNTSGLEGAIFIANSEGKEVMTSKLNPGENTISISTLNSGIYFIYEMNGSVSKIVKL